MSLGFTCLYINYTGTFPMLTPIGPKFSGFKTDNLTAIRQELDRAKANGHLTFLEVDLANRTFGPSDDLDNPVRYDVVDLNYRLKELPQKILGIVRRDLESGEYTGRDPYELAFDQPHLFVSENGHSLYIQSPVENPYSRVFPLKGKISADAKGLFAFLQQLHETSWMISPPATPPDDWFE